MNEQRAILETHKSHCDERVQSLRAYVKELTEMTAKCGTDEEHFHEYLWKAKSDLEFYEGQSEGICSTLEDADGSAAFHVYKDDAGEWRWHLKASNGRIIADSGEGYKERGACIHSIELVRSLNKAPVKDGH